MLCYLGNTRVTATTFTTGQRNRGQHFILFLFEYFYKHIILVWALSALQSHSHYWTEKIIQSIYAIFFEKTAWAATPLSQQDREKGDNILFYFIFLRLLLWRIILVWALSALQWHSTLLYTQALYNHTTWYLLPHIEMRRILECSNIIMMIMELPVERYGVMTSFCTCIL
jgi:hypothetical protein